LTLVQYPVGIGDFRILRIADMLIYSKKILVLNFMAIL